MSAQTDDAPRGFVTMREYRRMAERCEILEERLADMRRAQAPRRNIPRQTGDSVYARTALWLGEGGQVALTLIHLARQPEPLTTEALTNAVGLGNHCNVIICKLRHRLTAVGAPDGALRMIKGAGYWLSDEGRAWLRENRPEMFEQGATR